MNARLSYEELLTVLKEVENIVNNRPLIYMYDDVTQDVVTPNKLLFGRNLETSKKARYVNTLLEQWWRRWRDDYLVELREHQKVNLRHRSVEPKIGDIVFISDDKLKRAKWKIGRIIDLFVSNSMQRLF